MFRVVLFLPELISGRETSDSTPTGVGEKVDGRCDMGCDGEAQQEVELSSGDLASGQEDLKGHLRGEYELVALE